VSELYVRVTAAFKQSWCEPVSYGGPLDQTGDRLAHPRIDGPHPAVTPPDGSRRRSAAPGPGALTTLDTSAGNRAAPVPGRYDWSKAGSRGGQNLPGPDAVDPSCTITAAQLAGTYQVKPDDGVDDTAGIQSAIDKIHASCSPSASYTKLSLITFRPAP